MVIIFMLYILFHIFGEMIKMKCWAQLLLLIFANNIFKKAQNFNPYRVINFLALNHILDQMASLEAILMT